MKIVNKIEINGEVVSLCSEGHGIMIYQDGEDSTYIIKNGVVIFYGEMEHCCGEGGGGSLLWKKI
jgi:hypothetical protein|tara:strand:+ start:1064 stop:1258 length:195 start_codon:yes stop_codon:yes gene_type:complete